MNADANATLRGDYSKAAPDYSVEQDWSAPTAEAHALFRRRANRRFPVTVWLRKPEEVDYIAEPDVFHDFFGHVPLLYDPVYADHLCEYGKGGLKAMRLDAIP